MSAIWNYFSPPPPPSPPTKTDKPWRQSHGWGPEAKNMLKKRCEETMSKYKGKHINILLTGSGSAGKSSFYNSVCSVFKEWLTPMVHAGNAFTNLTRKFRKLEVKPRDSDPLPLRIYDTMGLEVNEFDEDVLNLVQVIEGHVPDGYELPRDREFTNRSPRYIKDPSNDDIVHCVVVVVDAEIAKEIHPDMKKKIRRLKKSMVDRDILVLVLLTKVDRICQHVHDDVSEVYHSIAVRDLVSYFATNLVQVPENHVLPVVNYVTHDKLNDNMDVLLLTAVERMLTAAMSFFELQSSD